MAHNAQEMHFASVRTSAPAPCLPSSDCPRKGRSPARGADDARARARCNLPNPPPAPRCPLPGVRAQGGPLGNRASGVCRHSLSVCCSPTHCPTAWTCFCPASIAAPIRVRINPHWCRTPRFFLGSGTLRERVRQRCILSPVHRVSSSLVMLEEVYAMDPDFEIALTFHLLPLVHLFRSLVFRAAADVWRLVVRLERK